MDDVNVVVVLVNTQTTVRSFGDFAVKCVYVCLDCSNSWQNTEYQQVTR